MRTKAATGRWWLLLLGCCLVASVEAKKKKKKGSSKYSKQEIADFIESSAVGEIRKQGCADEADACISNQKCLEEFIAATRSERPSNPCPLLKAVRDCGDTAIQKVKVCLSQILLHTFAFNNRHTDRAPFPSVSHQPNAADARDQLVIHTIETTHKTGRKRRISETDWR
eukprot:SAG31_NODE_645_length_13244_cov_11.768903_3_plen_169_part_00